MPKLPAFKPKEVLRKLKKRDFFIDHITGSHYILYKENRLHPVTVPMHNKDLKPGTLRGIIEQSGLTAEEFLKIKI